MGEQALRGAYDGQTDPQDFIRRFYRTYTASLERRPLTPEELSDVRTLFESQFVADLEAANGDLEAKTDRPTEHWNSGEADEWYQDAVKEEGESSLQSSNETNVSFKIIETSLSDEVNAVFWDVMGFEPPYRSGTLVTKICLTEKTNFVRVYDKINSRMQGGWVMRAEDIAGLTPQEIQDKFALPNVPIYICDVELDAGTVLRTGEANQLFGFSGGGKQYDLIVNGEKVGRFYNEREIEHDKGR